MAAAQKSTNTKRPVRQTNLALRPIAACVLAALAQCAAANPAGHQVAAGSASVQAAGKTLTITNTPGTILNWQSFSIAPGELTKFVQQSSASAVLNRVVAANPSSILGTLQSNGRVFLVNPHGIVIGAGALIDTAGFVASTLNIADKDFLAGKMKFEGGGAGVLRNEGTIQAARDIFLVGPKIENTGIIRSESGDVVLAAGKSVTITSPDAHGVQFGIQAPEDSVVNLGTIQASNAVGLFASTLKHSGEIKVTSASLDSAGRVVLSAQKDAFVDGSATISVDNSVGKGGQVQVLGERVGLFDNASITATGTAGGGEILIGGDYKGSNASVRNAWRTFVAPNARLSADALDAGDGGKVIVWADDITRFNGSISARGGARGGDGGFVETSGKNYLFVGESARVDARAPAGRTGNWLLDPRDIIVQAGGLATRGDIDDFSDTAGMDVTVAPVTISDNANVTLQANNDIIFNTDHNYSTIQSNNLTAQAGRSIIVNADILNTNPSTITLIANENAAAGVVEANRSAGAAVITMAPGKSITSGGNNVFLKINPGTGRIDPLKAETGNITIANIDGGNVSILHSGPTANGKILRADAASRIRVPNGGAVHMEIERTTLGGASIGTSAEPIKIEAPTATNQIFLEAHYHGGGDGIFIESASAVQVGGVPAGVFTGNVRGVQTRNEGGGAAGPIVITTPTTLSQFVGTNAVCGAAGLTGGPICAGLETGPSSALDATATVTLRATDMTLTRPIRGKEVTLLPMPTALGGTGNGTITPGSAAGTFNSLYLVQAEFDQIDTNVLRVGDNTSGAITFGAATITTPGSDGLASMHFTTGGTITTGTSGTDIAAGDASTAITLTGTSVGATGANRLKVVPGASSTVTATSTTGGIFLRQSAGALSTSRYVFNPAANQPIELATTSAAMTVDSSINVPGSALSLITTDISVTARSIAFTGTNTLTAGSLTFTTANGGAAQFNAGSATTLAAPVTTGATMHVNGGTVDFNGATASTLTGALSITGGALGGTGVVNANNGLTWQGGTIASTGGVTVPGTTTINTGNVQLSGTLSTGVLNVTGVVLNITNTGTLSLTNTTSTLNGATINNQGLTNYNTLGNDLLINNGSVFNNQAGATFDIQQNIFVRTSGGAGTFTNAGTVLKSGGAGAGGFDGSRALNNNGGALTSTSGSLVLGGGGNHTGTFTATGNVQLTGGVHTFNDASSIAGTTTLHLAGGTLSVPAGTATVTGTLEWDNTGVISGPGTLTIAPGASLNISGANTRQLTNVTLRNEGTVRYSTLGNDLLINNGSVFNNIGGATFDIQQNIFVRTSGGVGTFTNAGTVLKSGGAGAGGFDGSRAFDNAGGLLNVTSGSLELTGGGTHSGQFRTAGVNNVNLNGGTHTFTAGSSIDGPVFLNGGGVLDVSGNPTVSANAALQWNGPSTISGGTLSIAPLGILNIIGNASRTLSGATINNQGLTNYNTLGNDLLINNGSVFNNQAGATFDIQQNIFVRTSGGAGTFTNAGTVLKSGGAGAGGFDGSRALNNNGGALTSTSGSLVLGGGGNHTGTFTATGNVQLTGGVHTFNDASSIAGTTTLHLAGGTLSVPAGTATVTGTLEWDNTGVISGPGTLTIAPGASLNISGANTRQLTNVTLRNEGTVRYSTLGNDLLINNGSVFNNIGGATFDIQQNIFVRTSGGVGTFTNAGTVLKSGGAGAGGFDGSRPISNTNAGTLRVTSGTLQTLFAAGTNEGTITTAAGTTFSTGGSPLTNNGILAGNGNINLGAGVLLTNNGTISPGTSPGALTITGNLMMTGSSVTNVQIQPPGTTAGTDYDVLNVTGQANLAGTLNVAHTGGFSPLLGNNFTILNYGSRTGNFTTINSPLNFTYSGTPNVSNYMIAVTGAPTMNTWISATGAWETPGHWSLGHVPQSYEDAVIPDVGTPGISDTVTVSAAGQVARSVTSAENLRIASGDLTLGSQPSAVSAALTVAGGTLTANAALTAATLNLSGGTLTGPGAVTINNAFNWSAGTLTGTGAFTTANTATSSVNNFADVNLTGRTWDNFGTVNWTAEGSLVLSDAAATIDNKAGAVWNILTLSQVADVKGPGTFNNQAGATINANAPFTGGLSSNSINPATVNHAGTLNLMQGDLDFDNLSTVNFSGPINFSNGTRIVGYTGPGTTLNFNAGNSMTVAAGGAAILQQNFFNVNVNAATTVPSGLFYNQTAQTLTANAPLTFANGSAYSLSSGIVQGAGGVTLAGAGVWSGGSFIGPLTVSASGALNLTGANVKGLSGTTLTNAGTITVSDTGSLQLANGASVANNGFFSLVGDVGIQNNPSTATTFANAGTLAKIGGASTSAIGSDNQLTLTNSSTGSILVQSGTMQVNASFPMNSGTLNVGAGAIFSTNGQALTNTATGVVRGSGRLELAGNTFTNNGTLTPGASPGTLIVSGNYTQGPGGLLSIDIAGNQQGITYDFLQITGAANLDGTLQVILAPGYIPGPNDIFNFMSYASLTGNFSTFILPPGFILPTPGPFGYGITAPNTGTLLSSAMTASTNLATNAVIALREDEKLITENLEKVQEVDQDKQKGAVCS